MTNGTIDVLDSLAARARRHSCHGAVRRENTARHPQDRDPCERPVCHDTNRQSTARSVDRTVRSAVASLEPDLVAGSVQWRVEMGAVAGEGERDPRVRVSDPVRGDILRAFRQAQDPCRGSTRGDPFGDRQSVADDVADHPT